MSRLSRRMFLGAGTAALGLPFLGGYARGGQGTPAKRLVIVWTPNDAQWVDQYETPLTSGEALPASLPTFLQPLEPFRDRLAVLGGIDNLFEGGHTSIGHSLVARDWIGPDNNNFWAGGVSVDQHVAGSLGDTALTLGVSCGSKNGKGRMSYEAAEQPVDPIEDPAVAFENLFADLDLDETQLQLQRQRQHSILDRVAADLTAFETQVPAEQRPRLQQHLDGIRAIEEKIDDELLAGCDPTMPAALDTNDNSLVPQVMRAQMDIIAQALGCGATSVATLQLARAGGDVTPLWPEEGIEVGNGFHGIAHEHYLQPENAVALSDALALERWYSSQFAYLLGQLDAVPDVDGGTLLDHTLVVHVKELGRRHGTANMTYVVAGGPDIVTGNRYTNFGGRAHNDLLLTLCQKMGLADTTFGDPSMVTGPLSF